jgi:hypothetical protein
MMKSTDIDDIMMEYLNVGLKEHEYTLDSSSAAGMWYSETMSLIWAALQAPNGWFLTTGAFQGSSDIALGLVAKIKNTQLTSIDIRHQAAWWRNVYGRAHLETWVKAFDISSTKYKYFGQPISLACLDSWHTYKMLITEFNMIKDHLTPGAMILFHDAPSRAILPNKSGPPPVELVNEANRRHDELMATHIPETLDVEDKAAYHASEASQDFLIELAIAKICSDTGASLVELPEFGHVDRIDRTGGPWERAKTSPEFALRAIKL